MIYGTGISASGTLASVSLTTSVQAAGTLAMVMLGLGVALIILTLLFAAVAVVGLLPRGGS